MLRVNDSTHTLISYFLLEDSLKGKMVHIHKITRKDRNKKPRENELTKIRHLQDLCDSPDYKNEFAYNMTKLYRKTRQYQRN